MRVPWDRGGLRTYLVLLSLALTRPQSPALWWGAALVFLGVMLQVYAKGCLRQNQTVSMGGPYRFVRHPFYSANFLLDLGIAVMSGWWPLMVALPIWWLLVYVPTMRREEAILTGLFPDTYPEYQRRLPRLVPLRRPLPAEGEGFSWRNSNITEHTVIPRALRLSSYPLIFWTWAELRAGGLRPLLEGDPRLAGALAGLVVVYLLSSMLTRHLSRQRRLLPERPSAPALRAVTIILAIALAVLVHWGEVDAPHLLRLVGGLALAASLGLYLTGRQGARAAEGGGLAAVAVLGGVPWLISLPLLVYAALLLDARLAVRKGPPAETEKRPGPRLMSLAYLLLVLAGAVLALLKGTLFGRG